MKPAIRISVLIAAALALAACTAGSAESHHAATNGDLSQFVLGVWHGLIAPVSLIVEVINRLAPHALPWTMHLYESQDTGVVYDVGFYFGLLGFPFFGWSRWSRPRL